MTLFEIRAEMHKGSPNPDVILFYDEDREKAIAFMKKYDKQHGFSVMYNGHLISIATLLLVEREPTGKILNTTPYHEIFDIDYNRLDKGV